MSTEGIEWEVLQDCITSFLGPEAFASLERTQVLPTTYFFSLFHAS